MVRFVVGVVLASVVLYLWGWLFWGINPYPYQTWKLPADEALARDALLTQFPARGTYFIPPPKPNLAPDAVLPGPIAFVHITDVDGRPAMDPTIMGQGFGLNFVAVILIALLLHHGRAGLPTYGSRLAHATLAGLGAAVLIDLGDAVWFQIPWEWKIWQALYAWSAYIVSGVVLAAFIRPRPAAAATIAS